MSGKHKIEESPKKMKDNSSKKKKSDGSPVPTSLREIFQDGGAHGKSTGDALDRNHGNGDSTGNESPPKWFIAFEKRLEKNLHDIRNLVSFHSDMYDKKLGDMQAEIERVWDKVDELENRARRNNLVFFNIPEESEGSGPAGNCINFMNSFLREFVDPELSDLDIQRAHRTPPTGKPNPNLKPRSIHVFFGKFTEKESVRKAAIKAFKTKKYKDQKLFVSDDLSKRLQSKRKQLLPAKQKLRDEGKRPFFTFPATLKFWDNGVVRVYQPPLQPVIQMDFQSSSQMHAAASQDAN